MASYEELDKLPTDASKLLEQASGQVRDLDLDPATNIRRIGTALTYVFEVTHDIYALRPDLTPDILKK